MRPQTEQVPPDLQCPLCGELFREAVIIPCCGKSFCDSCIRPRLLEETLSSGNALGTCPECKRDGISPDSLIPNLNLRQAVLNFRNKSSFGGAAEESEVADSSNTKGVTVESAKLTTVSTAAAGTTGVSGVGATAEGGGTTPVSHAGTVESGRTRGAQNRANIICFRCKEAGHMAAECPSVG